MKLEPQVLGDKGQGRVLCSSDLISRVLLQGMAFFVSGLGGQVEVKVDCTALRIWGVGVFAVIAGAGGARLGTLVAGMSLVEAIEDGLALFDALTGLCALCSPSDALDGVCLYGAIGAAVGAIGILLLEGVQTHGWSADLSRCGLDVCRVVDHACVALQAAHGFDWSR